MLSSTRLHSSLLLLELSLWLIDMTVCLMSNLFSFQSLNLSWSKNPTAHLRWNLYLRWLKKYSPSPLVWHGAWLIPISNGGKRKSRLVKRLKQVLCTLTSFEASSSTLQFKFCWVNGSLKKIPSKIKAINSSSFVQYFFSNEFIHLQEEATGSTLQFFLHYHCTQSFTTVSHHAQFATFIKML